MGFAMKEDEVRMRNWEKIAEKIRNFVVKYEAKRVFIRIFPF